MTGVDPQATDLPGTALRTATDLALQGIARLARVQEIARATFPTAYTQTIQPLLAQVEDHLRSGSACVPSEAAKRAQAAIESLHDLDSLFEAYSLSGSR